MLLQESILSWTYIVDSSKELMEKTPMGGREALEHVQNLLVAVSEGMVDA